MVRLGINIKLNVKTKFVFLKRPVKVGLQQFFLSQSPQNAVRTEHIVVPVSRSHVRDLIGVRQNLFGIGVCWLQGINRSRYADVIRFSMLRRIVPQPSEQRLYPVVRASAHRNQPQHGKPLIGYPCQPIVR